MSKAFIETSEPMAIHAGERRRDRWADQLRFWARIQNISPEFKKFIDEVEARLVFLTEELAASEQDALDLAVQAADERRAERELCAKLAEECECSTSGLLAADSRKRYYDLGVVHASAQIADLIRISGS